MTARPEERRLSVVRALPLAHTPAGATPSTRQAERL
jgi:hypothetical protein